MGDEIQMEWRREDGSLRPVTEPERRALEEYLREVLGEEPEDEEPGQDLAGGEEDECRRNRRLFGCE